MLLQGSNRMTAALAKALDLLFDGAALGRRVLGVGVLSRLCDKCAVQGAGRPRDERGVRVDYCRSVRGGGIFQGRPARSPRRTAARREASTSTSLAAASGNAAAAAASAFDAALSAARACTFMRAAAASPSVAFETAATPRLGAAPCRSRTHGGERGRSSRRHTRRRRLDSASALVDDVPGFGEGRRRRQGAERAAGAALGRLSLMLRGRATPLR